MKTHVWRRTTLYKMTKHALLSLGLAPALPLFPPLLLPLSPSFPPTSASFPSKPPPKALPKPTGAAVRRRGNPTMNSSPPSPVDKSHFYSWLEYRTNGMCTPPSPFPSSPETLVRVAAFLLPNVELLSSWFLQPTPALWSAICSRRYRTEMWTASRVSTPLRVCAAAAATSPETGVVASMRPRGCALGYCSALFWFVHLWLYLCGGSASPAAQPCGFSRAFFRDVLR